MKNIFSGGVFFVLSMYTVNGQDTLWTFQNCINYAIEHNVPYKQQELSHEITSYNLKKAEASRWPDLNFNGSQNFQYGRTVDPFTYQFTTANNRSGNYQLSSSLLIFNGLQNHNNIRSQRIGYKAEEFDIEKYKNDLMVNVLNAFLQVLLNEDLVHVGQLQVESSQALVDRTEKLVQAGSLAQSNLLQVEAQLATDRYTLINDQNQLLLAKVSLMQLMELPVTDSFNVARPNVERTLLETASLPLLGSNEVYDSALYALPDIKAARFYVESSKYALKSAYGGYYPSLTVSGSVGSGYSSAQKLFSTTFDTVTQQIGYLAGNPSQTVLAEIPVQHSTPENYPFKKQLKNNLSERVNINLSIPIYNNNQSRTNVSIAKVNLLNQKYNLDNAKNTLRKEVEQSVTDLKAARLNYEAAMEQQKTNERAYKDAEKKYELGLIQAYDLLVAKNNYIQAQANLQRAIYQFIFSAKVIDYYIGKPIQF